MGADIKMEQNEPLDPARESFLTEPLGGLIVKNALPAIISMLFMAFYQMVDAMMVGRRLGPDALASVNILYPILAVFVGLAVMIGVGGNARIAVLLGAGKTRQANETLGLIVLLGSSLGILGSICTLLFFPNILEVLGTSGTLGQFAGEYLQIMYPFFTPMILFFILEQSLRNDGRAGLASFIMVTMAVLNIVLDYLFLFVLDLGIGGAALASGLSQTLGAILFLIYFGYKRVAKRQGLSFAAPGGGRSTLGAIVINGSSELFNNLAAGITTFLFNRMIISYVGTIGVAAFSVTQYLLTVGWVVAIGLGNGVQPIISYNYGAGLKRRVEGVLLRLLFSSLSIGVIFFYLMRLQGEPLAALFVPDHKEALEMTLQIATTVSWSMLFIPIGILTSIFFTAIERAKASLMIAIGRSLVFILLGLAIFPPIFGEMGIWITQVFAEGATLLVGMSLLYQWMYQEKMAEVKGVISQETTG